jgi:hypothetical protein
MGDGTEDGPWTGREGQGRPEKRPHAYVRGGGVLKRLA